MATKVKKGQVDSGLITKTNIGMSTSQSLTADVQTKINFDTVNFDTAGEFNTTSDRWIASRDGYAIVMAQVGLSTPSRQYGQIKVFKNGAQLYTTFRGTDDIYQNTHTATWLVSVAAGDYLEIYLLHGASVTVNGGNNGTCLFTVLGIYV